MVTVRQQGVRHCARNAEPLDADLWRRNSSTGIRCDLLKRRNALVSLVNATQKHGVVTASSLPPSPLMLFNIQQHQITYLVG